MIRLVVSNQRGGVAKTTTVTTMARVFADMGMKVLIIDTDSQGSVASILNLKPENYLYNFLVNNQAFRDCIVEAGPNVHVMCSNRRTVEAEAVFMGVTGREMAFDNVVSLGGPRLRRRPAGRGAIYYPASDLFHGVCEGDPDPRSDGPAKSARRHGEHPDGGLAQ